MSRDRTYWFAWGALFLAVLGIVIFRAPEMVFAPSLLFDEGAKVFAHFYEQREAAQILRFKSGYLPLIGNLIGYLAVRLPTRCIPYALVGSAVFITSVTYSLFFGRYFRRWIPSDLSRALICLVFALAPIADCLLVTMSDYSLWNLLIILILLTVWRPSVRPIPRYLLGFLTNLLVWSHPLSIIVAPLVLWRAFNDEENRTFFRVMFFNLIVHQIFGVAGVLTTHGLWDHSTGVPLGVNFASKLFDACGWSAQIVTATAYRSAFGVLSFESITRERSVLPIIWIVAVTIAACWVGFKVRRIRSLLFALGYLIISLTFLTCFLRYEDVHDDPIGFINYSPRYIYIQSLCFLLLFGTVLIHTWELAWSKIAVGALGTRCARLSFLPLVALICYYGFLNTQLGYCFAFNTQRAGPYYDPDPQNGLIVREFFAKLADQERLRGSRQQIQLTAQKISDWPIVVDTTSSHPPVNLRLSRRARVFAIALTLVAFGYLSRDWWMRRLRPKH